MQVLVFIIIAHPALRRNAQFCSLAAVRARGFTFGGKICIMELEGIAEKMGEIDWDWRRIYGEETENPSKRDPISFGKR